MHAHGTPGMRGEVGRSTDPLPAGHRRRAQPSAKGSFGAGLVAGASDNDPTTVATLAVIGSTTIYELG